VIESLSFAKSHGIPEFDLNSVTASLNGR
jgi:hypothetical protein